jgi:hypothetical protein
VKTVIAIGVAMLIGGFMVGITATETIADTQAGAVARSYHAGYRHGRRDGKRIGQIRAARDRGEYPRPLNLGD